MDNREKNIFEWLQKKQATLTELLRVTNLAHLTGDNKRFEREAESYSYMIESREQILEEVQAVDQKLEGMGYRKLKETPGYHFPEVILAMEETVRDLVLRIIELDKANNEKARMVAVHLTNAIKGVHMGKNANAAYHAHAYTHPMAGGGYYDSKH